ncbi:ATP-binding protein [Planobispora longispora]|uniref:ATP-binding protein n=1 Tax=Planobispora longispora TaxID=28887 RepID=A0A8J3W974_9ACTN|nr:ATP-binding protein [Planobispora longispora]GIH79561.1 ATP-binding protein [Planobispora longispora]
MVTGQQIVPPRSTVTLRGVPESVAVARHRAMELLGEGHPAFEDVVLLVSEVVTNSVVHSGSAGGGRVAMTLAVEAGTVTVEVRDAGSADSVPRVRIAPDEEGGRGMFLVDLLAARWGVRQDGSRGPRTVWFQIAF